jgi:CHAT domain
MSSTFFAIQSEQHARQELLAANKLYLMYEQHGRQEDAVNVSARCDLLLDYFQSRHDWESWIQVQGLRSQLNRAEYERSESPVKAEESEEALKAIVEVAKARGWDFYVAKAINGLGLLAMTRLQVSMDATEKLAAMDDLQLAINQWESEGTGPAHAKTRFTTGQAYALAYLSQERPDPRLGDLADAAFADARTGWPNDEPGWPRYSLNIQQGSHALARALRETASEHLKSAARYAESAIVDAAHLAIGPPLAKATALMARIQEEQKDWAGAAETIGQFLRQASALFVNSRSPEEYWRLLKLTSPLSRKQAIDLARAGRLDEAIRAADSGRGVYLTEKFLLQKEAYARGGADYWRRVRTFFRILDTAPTSPESMIAIDPNAPRALKVLYAAREAASSEIAELQAASRAAVSNFSPSDLLLSNKTAIVLFCELEDTIAALIVQCGHSSFVDLKPLRPTDLKRQLFSGDPSVRIWSDQLKTLYHRAIDQEESIATEPDSSLRNETNGVLSSIIQSRGQFSAGYYNSYHLTFSRLARRLDAAPSLLRQAKRLTVEQFDACLKETQTFCQARLLQPLADHLEPGITHLLVSESGDMSLLPLQLAAYPQFSFGLIPSIVGWAELESRGRVARTDGAAILTPATDLLMSELEAYWVWKRFNEAGKQAKLFHGASATVERFWQELAQADTLHFAGHAQFAWQYVHATTLELADGPVSMRNLQQSLDADIARFVFLSACESGLVDSLAFGDEMAGLPATFLELGASAVVSSAWPVDDVCAALYCDEFYYQRLIKKASVHEAVKNTSLWLINATKGEICERLGQVPISQSGRERLQRLLPDLRTTPEHGIPSDLSIERLTEAVLAAACLVSTTADERPFAKPRHWGAFVAIGAALAEADPKPAK